MSALRTRLRALAGGERPILRAQLAILYSGFFLCLLVLVLGAAGLLIVRSSQSNAAGHLHPSSGPPARAFIVLGIGAVATALAVVGAWWLAGRFLRPLRAITSAAEEISATNLHRRLELSGPDDELTQLGSTLNGLFGRLEAAFETQRRFVANASHELRTPLAGQRTVLQVALGDPQASTESLRAACEQALTLGAQQERLIDALLTLATSERGIEHHQAIDLAELARKAITGRAELAQSRAITVESSLSPARASGASELAELLVANLVDNALRHNVDGGTITVETATASGQPTLTVLNTGPLVPETTLAYLFEPFRTTGAERVRHRDGHGLGLAIVQAVAQAHDAKIEARPRAAGGLEVTVIFKPVT